MKYFMFVSNILMFCIVSLILIVYLDSFANNSFVVNIRHNFIVKILEPIFFRYPNKLPYSFEVERVFSKDKVNRYSYSVIGRLKSIDRTSRKIEIIDKDGKIWRFNYVIDDYVRIVVGSGYKIIEETEHKINDGNIQDDESLKVGDLMGCNWNSLFTKSQIETSRRNGDTIVMEQFSKIPIQKIIINTEK